MSCWATNTKSGTITIERVKGGYIVHYKVLHKAHPMSGDPDWWEAEKEVFTSLEDALKFIEGCYK